MRHGSFSLEWLAEQTFEGFTRGDTWNSWECPFFSFEVAEQIAEAYEKLGHWASFHETDDAFYFRTEGEDEAEGFGSVAVDGHKLYPIGAGVWIWEKAQSIVDLAGQRLQYQE